jgi:putative Holliday junction resolvase
VFDIIGIDWGSKRTGIALGNTSSLLSIPYSQEISHSKLESEILKLLRKYDIHTIVFGLPLNSKSQPTEITTKIHRYIKQLQPKIESTNIITVDERYSTKDAQRLLDAQNLSTTKHHINNLSAHIILSQYLTSQNS